MDFKAAIREPLLHFLVIGAALFGLYATVSPDQPADLDKKVIVVDRASLLTFVQYRLKAFKPDAAASRLNAMSDADRKRLIDDFVREEALHREALALGMDASDYIIKRRLIQKVEFLARGFADAGTALNDEAIRAHYEANKKDYYVQPSVTFTHVFFDASKRGTKAAEIAAIAKREKLNADRVPFANAPRHGDRFPYHVNYVERTPDYVASHFGPGMAREVFALKGDERAWRGPYRSPYGTHLVMVSKTEPGRIPTLDDVRRRVTEDARRAQARARLDAAIARIVDGYDVRIADDVRNGSRVIPAKAAQ